MLLIQDRIHPFWPRCSSPWVSWHSALPPLLDQPGIDRAALFSAASPEITNGCGSSLSHELLSPKFWPVPFSCAVWEHPIKIISEHSMYDHMYARMIIEYVSRAHLFLQQNPDEFVCRLGWTKFYSNYGILQGEASWKNMTCHHDCCGSLIKWWSYDLFCLQVPFCMGSRLVISVNPLRSGHPTIFKGRSFVRPSEQRFNCWFFWLDMIWSDWNMALGW